MPMPVSSGLYYFWFPDYSLDYFRPLLQGQGPARKVSTSRKECTAGSEVGSARLSTPSHTSPQRQRHDTDSTA